MNINYSIFILLIPLVLLQIQPCSGTAKLMLRFDSFDNTGFLAEDGTCCDGEQRNGNCTGRCDYSIRVCLSRNSSGDLCEIESFEVGSVDVLTSSFSFPGTFVSGFANPVPITLSEWEGEIVVTVIVSDVDTLREERVDSFTFTYTQPRPIVNRALVTSDYITYALTGKRTISPTTLNAAVTVQCDRFYYGQDCLVNCVENDDCNGHYSCNQETGDKICYEGWGGQNCSISTSDNNGCFSFQQCDNRAECVRYGAAPSEFYCCCAPGFTGTNCEIDIDECADEPCQNGGNCIQDEPNSFECNCPPRFTGETCAIQRTCDDEPCLNGGDCRSVVDSFFCLCNVNYTGDICETLVNPPTTLPNCPQDYYGPSCSIFCQARDDCSGHYTCDAQNGNKLCNPTWGGINCTERTFIDATCPCQNGGQCFNSQCCCQDGFTGNLCEIIQFCEAGSCINGGQCFNEPTRFRCECAPGFTGERCDLIIPPSTTPVPCPENYFGQDCSVFCQPQDDCYAGQWACHPATGQRLCRFGWTGVSCNQRDPSARHSIACPDSNCRNGGICTNTTCCCPIGYRGSLCHIEILECATRPCLNNGRCEDLIGDYLCNCPAGFTGKNCEFFIGTFGSTPQPDPCLQINCLNGGTCLRNTSTEAFCLCAEGFNGDRCQSFAVAPTPPGQRICPDNLYGPECQTFCREDDSCAGGHFYCDPVTGFRICRSGWTGSLCNTRIVPQDFDPACPVVGCRNGGQCFNETCCCPRSTRGQYCQEEVLPCNRQPCRNGGSCQDLENGFSCICPPGYSDNTCGTFIGFPTDPPSTTESTDLENCDQIRCLNGGFCVQIVLPFNCVCVAPFTGRYCEVDTTNSSTDPTTPTGQITGSTAAPSIIRVIYLRGNVSDNDQRAIELILQASLDTSMNDTCCFVVYILERTRYVDSQGNVVVGYLYNITSTNGIILTPMTQQETLNFNSIVNNQLRTTTPFGQDGVEVYTGPVTTLTDLGFTYSVDLIGRIEPNQRQAVIADIERTWRAANPDCACVFTATLAMTQEYTGDYGITVSRVYYTITRDGADQNPSRVEAPSRQFFLTTLSGSASDNSLYTGSMLIPYNMHHQVLLNGALDSNTGQIDTIRNALQAAWVNWRNTNPAVPQNLRNLPVQILLLRPETYYRRIGRLTNLKYYVVLNGTYIIGPQSGSAALDNPMFCNDCQAIPVPYLDVMGSLTVTQIRALGGALNPSDPNGFTATSQEYLDSNGEIITRVYYTPQISDPDVQSTAASRERVLQVLTLLGLEEPSLPIEKSFVVNVEGSVGDDRRDAIRQAILDSWVTTLNIPRNVISVEINNMDDNFVSQTNGQVTQVTYTVAIQGADSYWTRFEGLDLPTLRQYLITRGFVIVDGVVITGRAETTPTPGPVTTPRVTESTPRVVTSPTVPEVTSPVITDPPPPLYTNYVIQTIYLRGNTTGVDQETLDGIVTTALNNSVEVTTCCVRVQYIDKITYIDSNGNIVTGYRYNVSRPGSSNSTLTQTEVTEFTNVINNEVQGNDVFRIGGVVIYAGTTTGLTNVRSTYSIDLVGDIPESRRQELISALERAWTDFNPGCNCQFSVNIVQTEELSGTDYGIKVNRVYYTVTRDGQEQNPDVVPPPTYGVLTNTIQNLLDLNQLYVGGSLVQYSRRHNVLLNGDVDMTDAQGAAVMNAIQTAWLRWRNTDPSVPDNLRSAPLRVLYLRPQTYYTQDGRQLTRLEYFVILNNTLVISPDSANVVMTDPIFCPGCDAVPVPYVDIQGQLTPTQVQDVVAALNYTVPPGVTVRTETFIGENGVPVTRIFYQPPISGPGVETTAVSDIRLTEILNTLNLQQPTVSVDRSYVLYLDGPIDTSNRDAIERNILNAWSSTLGIPSRDVNVRVTGLDDRYFNADSNSPVTQVTYTVAVKGADSQWTRYQPVDPATLGLYFTSPDLVVVTSEVTDTQRTTIPVGETTAVPGVTGSTVAPGPQFYIQTVYFQGDIGENNQPAVEDILTQSLNQTMSDRGCCFRLQIIERTSYMDPNGNVVVGYRYNVTNTTGGTVVTMSPEESTSFTNDVTNRLRQTAPFNQLGVVLFPGSLQVLSNVENTYTVDFVGDVPESQRQVIMSFIEQAWHQAYPDCNCVFRAIFVYKDTFAGDFGTTVSRLYYQITRDGQVQDPTVTAGPSRSALFTLVQPSTRVTPVYAGSSLMPYRQRHNILLNSIVDMNSDEGTNVRNTIRDTWINWRNTNPAVPPNLRNLPLDIILLRPQRYYTEDGRELTYLEYFVVLNGTLIISPTSTVSMPNSIACNCIGMPVPYVDVIGQLTPVQLQDLRNRFNPTDTSPIQTEMLINTNGETATRVYYRLPAGQTTPYSPDRIRTILASANARSPTLPVDKTFTINFAGDIGDENRAAIELTIVNAWAGILDIPRDVLAVNILNMDNSYVDFSNGEVTQVTYTVSIQGADSRWTRYEGVNPGVLEAYAASPTLIVVTTPVIRIQRETTGATPSTVVTPRETTAITDMTTPVPVDPISTMQVVYLRGNISDNNLDAVEVLLQEALNRTINSGTRCCLTLSVIEKTSYVDANGEVVTGYRLNITSLNGSEPTAITTDDVRNFTQEVNNEISNSGIFGQLGVVIYTGPIDTLLNVDYTYTVDFIGTIQDSQRELVITDIEKAWQAAYPDCRCLFKANIVKTDEFSGDHGIVVSRVTYTITRDGTPQDPKSVQGPAQIVFFTTVRNDATGNAIYAGSTLLPYNQRHSVLLNGDVDMTGNEGTQIRDTLLRVWTTWRDSNPAVPENLRNAKIDLVLLRPKLYYSQNGETLTNLEYYVILNNTLVVGPQSSAPSVTGPQFCGGCSGLPVPFVDIKSVLSTDAIQLIARTLNPSDPNSDTVTSQRYFDSNNEEVTRIYYRPPISGPDVTSTAIPQERLREILTMFGRQQPPYPVKKSYVINFAGRLNNNNRDSIIQTIRNVWSGTFNVPAEDIAVDIVEMDDSYTNPADNGPVTQVTYTVSIQGADSHWTRFQGVDPGTLGQYVTDPNLVVVVGEILRTQGQTTPTPSTAATPSPTTARTTRSSAPPPTTTNRNFLLDTIYFQGNISTNSEPVLQSILQAALNASLPGEPCCIQVRLVERTDYVDADGSPVVGYRYNITTTTGNPPTPLTPVQTRTFITSVNNVLQRSQPFSREGIRVFPGSRQELQNIGFAYTIDVIGTIPSSSLDKIKSTIETAWRNANPDCGCEFSANIILTDEYSGDYGTVVTRVYYTINRDGTPQRPSNVAPPTSSVFRGIFEGDTTMSEMYAGSELYLYNQRHSVLLNSVVDINSAEGSRIVDTLRSDWNRWRNNDPRVPEEFKSASLEIIPLQPQTYYTQAGNSISKLDYFVVINGNLIIGPRTANATISSSILCGCEAVPVPYVDVNGKLTWTQLVQLGTALNPDDTTGSTLEKDTFYTTDSQTVTRVYYRPAISGPNVKSTAVSQEQVTEIFTNQNLEQPSLPLEKSFVVYLNGSIGDDKKDAVAEGIRTAWSGTFNIPNDALTVNVIDMDNKYYRTTGNGQVTKVTYTMAVNDADSHWTKYSDIDSGNMNQRFASLSDPSLALCACIARAAQDILLTGTVQNDTAALEAALISAWKEANPDYSGSLAVGIKNVEGSSPTKLTYVVEPSGGPQAFTETDLVRPSNDVIDNQISPLDLTVYRGPAEDTGRPNWVIPVAVVLAILLLIIIIVVIILVIRNRRNRMSHTLKQKPSELNGYDKQHFSDEPHFDNPAYDMNDPDLENGKQKTYVVNEDPPEPKDPTMEEIKLQ